MERAGSQSARRGLRVMEFERKATRPEQIKLIIPGLDNPTMERIGSLCEQALGELDSAVGWNDASRDRPGNNVASYRHKARGAFSEAMLNAFAALQHMEHADEH